MILFGYNRELMGKAATCLHYFLGHRIDYLSNDVSIFSEVCAEKSFFPLGATGV